MLGVIDALAASILVLLVNDVGYVRPIVAASFTTVVVFGCALPLFISTYLQKDEEDEDDRLGGTPKPTRQASTGAFGRSTPTQKV